MALASRSLLLQPLGGPHPCTPPLWIPSSRRFSLLFPRPSRHLLLPGPATACPGTRACLLPLPPACSRPFPAAAMSNNMAKIAEARKTVEQLKLEVNIDRMKVPGPGEGGSGGPPLGAASGTRVVLEKSPGKRTGPRAGRDKGRNQSRGRSLKWAWPDRERGLPCKGRGEEGRPCGRGSALGAVLGRGLVHGRGLGCGLGVGMNRGGTKNRKFPGAGLRMWAWFRE